MTQPEDLSAADPGTDRNLLGEPLVACGQDPVTGYFRDGSCRCDPADEHGRSTHWICVVVTGDFLTHQQEIGNDLISPRPEWGFPGLVPGDRWCVVAARWLASYDAGRAAPVVLAATNERALEIVPLEALRAHAVDVPDDVRGLLGD